MFGKRLQIEIQKSIIITIMVNIIIDKIMN